MTTEDTSSVMPDDQAKDSRSGQARRPENDAVARGSDAQILAQIRTAPGLTEKGRPFDHVVRDKVALGRHRLELIPAQVVGTARPVEVYRATRARNSIINPWSYKGNDNSYCPSHWGDIVIGEGACGFRCRACFLILTHRCFCDPSGRNTAHAAVGGEFPASSLSIRGAGS